MIIENDVEYNSSKQLCCVVKCIGGCCDGQRVLLIKKDCYEGKWKPKSVVQVSEPFPKISSFNPKEEVEAATINMYNYIINVFHFNKEEIYYYLVPEDWSYKKAIKHQMRK